MRVVATDIPEVLVFEPTVHGDERGFFVETWRHSEFEKLGLDATFVQVNQSKSSQGTLRGLHYQVVNPQGKLVRAIEGEIFDVAVDIRQSSPTFGQWVGEILSADNHRQLWVPPGFAHGFYVLSSTAQIVYKCTQYYAPEGDRSLSWNDSELGIEWPVLDTQPLLSEKDEKAPTLRDAELFP